MITPTTDLNLLIEQSSLRDIADWNARAHGINTFHFKCVFNDGMDCQYEYLNEDGTIFDVTVILVDDPIVERYRVTVMRNLRDDDGDRTREWVIESDEIVEMPS